MKVSKKAVIITSLSVIGAAAVAVPVGVVFGTRSSGPTQAEPGTTVTIVKTEPLDQVYTFGTDRKTAIRPPPLAADGYAYNPEDYQPGTTDGPEFDKKTKAGPGAAKITFTYVPKTENTGPTFVITYPLNTAKGTPTVGFGPGGSGTESESKSVAYGINSFAQVEEAAFKDGIDFWLSGKDYRDYYDLKESTESERNPQYFEADGTTPLVDEGKLATIGANMTFKAVYKFFFISEQFFDKTTEGAQMPAEGTLTVTYTVQPVTLQASSVTVSENLQYATDNFAYPTPPEDARKEHYALVSPTPTAKIVTKPDGATVTPASGQPVDLTKVKDYEVGTVFTVAFKYAPEAPNYTGSEYEYIYTYTIVVKALTRPDIPQVTLKTVEFGMITEDQKKAQPVELAGFNGEFVDVQITAPSSVSNSNTTLSPAVGDTFEWSKAKTYNSGTRYVLTFSYKAKPNFTYDGEPILVRQEYEIVKQKVAGHSNEFRAADDRSYAYGADPTKLPVPEAAKGFTVGATPVFYAGNAQPADTAATITPKTVMETSADQFFVAEWTASLDTTNYELQNPNDATSYKIAIPYKIGKKAASYESDKKSYVGVEIRYGDDLPADFVPQDPKLPDESKNVGYKYKSVSYKLTRKADDNSGPELNASIDSTAAIKLYRAGTVITATFVFEATGEYAGQNVEITKTIKILKKRIDQPTAPATTPALTEVTWGTAQSKPTAPPAAPEGYKPGTYGDATFAARPTSGPPSSTDTVDWSKFATYGLGTIITVTWTYQPDSVNYEKKDGTALAPTTLTTQYKIIQAPAVRPAGLTEESANVYKAATISYSGATTKGDNPDVKFPSPETATKFPGYKTPTLESVKISKKEGNGTFKIGDPVIDWAQANKFGKGSEFEAKFKYVSDENHTADEFYYVVTYRTDKSKVELPEIPGTTLKEVGSQRDKVFEKIEIIRYVKGTIPPGFPIRDLKGTPILDVYYECVSSGSIVVVPPPSNYPYTTKTVTSWEEAKDYPVGTVIEIDYRYSPVDGYEGDNFTYAVKLESASA